MELLIFGGTAWVGHHLAAEALRRGHQVTALARGTSGAVPDGAELVVADRADEEALATLAARRWDAVVDVGRHPGHVRRSATALAPVASTYLFVSSGSVYANDERPGQDESAPVRQALAADMLTDMAEYGEAKVACEEHVRAAFGPQRSLIARAGLIGGPGDHTGRSGYWPWRFAHPSTPDGTVLVPAGPELGTQVIDVRDLVEWLVDAAEQQLAGTFNAVGQSVPLSEHLRMAREVAGHTGPVRAADPDWLAEQGVEEWMGPRSLPLWIHDPAMLGFGDVDASAARAAGLSTRPLTETLRSALDYEQSRPAGIPRGAGLTDQEERDLLALLADR